MRRQWSIGALALMALCATACSTPATQAPAAPPAQAAPSYSEAVRDLIAATLTRGEFQSTTMEEVGRCRFAFAIAPGRQSYLQFSFDVRQLNLNAVTTAQGQARHSDFSRRIACATEHGDCASYTGMPAPFIEIAAPTADDAERALGALRNLQTICQSAPSAGE